MEKERVLSELPPMAFERQFTAKYVSSSSSSAAAAASEKSRDAVSPKALLKVAYMKPAVWLNTESSRPMRYRTDAERNPIGSSTPSTDFTFTTTQTNVASSSSSFTPNLQKATSNERGVDAGVIFQNEVIPSPLIRESDDNPFLLESSFSSADMTNSGRNLTEFFEDSLPIRSLNVSKDVFTFEKSSINSQKRNQLVKVSKSPLNLSEASEAESEDGKLLNELLNVSTKDKQMTTSGDGESVVLLKNKIMVGLYLFRSISGCGLSSG